MFNSASGYITSSPNITWTQYPMTTSASYVTVPAPPPRKRSALDWLEDEIERVCAVTRPGLALS